MDSSIFFTIYSANIHSHQITIVQKQVELKFNFLITHLKKFEQFRVFKGFS